jgi:hypothetical protein
VQLKASVCNWSHLASHPFEALIPATHHKPGSSHEKCQSAFDRNRPLRRGPKLGKFRFNEKGDPSLPPYAVYRWSNGTYEEIGDEAPHLPVRLADPGMPLEASTVLVVRRARPDALAISADAGMRRQIA